MKKLTSLLLVLFSVVAFAQSTANRFIYELNYKPKKDSSKIEKVFTILDITQDKSIYQDYTIISQDSIMKVEIEELQKSGMMKDLSKKIRQPKFSSKVYKSYPGMKIQFVEKIANGFTPTTIGYDDASTFNWKIENEKKKIGAYNAQKATTEFGGRKWVAWFSSDLPFQDGPYKFSGLPGLIIQIEDVDKNYSWELIGNTKVNDYTEYSYIEKAFGLSGGKPVIVSRDKFDKTFNDFKKDPFATVRPMLTSEMLSSKMPGMDGTVGDMLKKQEKEYKDFYSSIDNTIEIANEKK